MTEPEYEKGQNYWKTRSQKNKITGKMKTIVNNKITRI